MASTGFTLAGTGANNADAGDNAWGSPGSVTASDDTRSTATCFIFETTQYLHATNFGFSLPASSTIDGIEVRIERRTLTTNGVKDLLVQLIKGGTRSGDDKADTGTNWPTTDTNKDYGGAADLWSLTLTESDVEASTFGVALRAQHNSGPFPDASVDAIWINVHYTESGGGPTVKALTALGVG